MATHRAKADEYAAIVRSRAPITDRVNGEPPILNGMTASEAQMIGLVSLVAFLMVGALLFAVTGYWQAILILGILGPLLTLWFGSKYLARIKRGRPDGYYVQAIHLWLVGHGLAQPKFITYSGFWSLGRTLALALSSPLNPPGESLGAPQGNRAAHAAKTSHE